MSSKSLLNVLDSLARPRVLIVGDLILDRYITGDVRRISPEAPIPVLAATAREARLGGAGNVAANLRSMEAEVEVVGLVGGDSDGAELLELLGQMGVETARCVTEGGRPTTVKTRMISGAQQMIRIDWEEARAMAEGPEQQLLGCLFARIGSADAVLLSDYGKGVLTPRVLRAAIDEARRLGKPVLVDPKGSDYSRYRGATLLTPNRKEAEEALGRRIASFSELPAAARELQSMAELDASLITLGADGIFYLAADGQHERVPTMARAVFDVTGAGDTVIAHLTLALASGLPLSDAVRLANHAAGLVVARRGACSVTRDELRAALDGDAHAESSKLCEGPTLDAKLARWRSEGRRIVFTNGCFDVLHAGHVQYLRFAASKGDRLVVGVNDDASVQRLKGQGRPVNPLTDRMDVLAALEMVDAVTSFAQDTPLETIQRVTPNALVKGEDWADKGVVGREWVESHGGEVHLAPLLAGRSTTSILERGGRAPN